MSTTQIVLAVLGSGALFSFLSVALTLYFQRRRTGAEVVKITADAHKAEAEATGEWAEQVRTVLGDLRVAVNGLTDCQKEKAAEVIRRQEVEADNRQLKSANEILSKQNTDLQEMVTELRQKVREGV